MIAAIGLLLQKKLLLKILIYFWKFYSFSTCLKNLKATCPLDLNRQSASDMIYCICVNIIVCFIMHTNWITVSDHVKLFDPLLILYVCPLTKKWSVYNFNGRVIWTVRDRTTTTKIQTNAFQKSYKLICILMSEISIWPLRKTWFGTLWQNPCWQSQRSDVSFSWPLGLHTSQEGFCPTPLYRSSSSR